MADSADRYDRRAFLARGATTAAARGAGREWACPPCSPACGTTTPTPHAASSTPGIGHGTPKRGGSDHHRPQLRDRRLPALDEPLRQLRPDLRQHHLRHLDGGGRRRLGQALPGPVGDPQPRHDGVDDHAAPRGHVPRRVAAERRRPAGQHPGAADLGAHRPGPARRGAAACAKTSDLAVAVTCAEPIVAFPHYLATQVGYVVGHGPAREPELDQARRHGAVLLGGVGAQRPHDGEAQPPLLARRAPLPRRRDLQAHPRGPVPGELAASRGPST